MTDTTTESFERKVARVMTEFYIMYPERTTKICKKWMKLENSLNLSKKKHLY